MSLSISKFASNSSTVSTDPVVLFLHGYGADERDLPDLMSFLPKLDWYSPRAPIDLGGGFSWYATADLLNPPVADLSENTQVVWNWVDEYIPKKVKLILIGFSQGGLMATQLLRTRPERIAGTVILSGFLAVGELESDAELSGIKPKVIYCRGLADQRISKDAIARLNNWLQLHTKAITKTYPALGHSVDERVMTDVAEYLSGQLL